MAVYAKFEKVIIYEKLKLKYIQCGLVVFYCHILGLWIKWSYYKTF